MVGQGAAGFSQGLGQAVDLLWLWCSCSKSVLRLLVSFLAGSSEPYVRAV